jgi:hypothetical protein
MIPDLGTEWRKSSYSNASGGDCVEVALGAQTAGLRDSKNPGPQLAFSRAAFRAFLGSVGERQHG